jgi:hypothetical protein
VCVAAAALLLPRGFEVALVPKRVTGLCGKQEKDTGKLDRETSDGNDGVTSNSNERKSKVRGHFRSAPTTAQPADGS